MTLSEREIGELQQRIKMIEHRARNDRTVANLLQQEVDGLRSDLERLRTRIYATIASLGLVASAVAWFVDLVRN